MQLSHRLSCKSHVEVCSLKGQKCKIRVKGVTSDTLEERSWHLKSKSDADEQQEVT